MPDLDFRSSASFISSKEGGMPVSRTRSWMNIKSSYCLRVSINPSQIPEGGSSQRREPAANKAETSTNRSTLVPDGRQRAVRKGTELRRGRCSHCEERKILFRRLLG